IAADPSHLLSVGRGARRAIPMRTRTHSTSWQRFRRPAFDILEDRRPVAESIGPIATTLALAGPAHAAPPPQIAHLNMAAAQPSLAAPGAATTLAHGLTPTENVALVPPASAGNAGTGAAPADFLNAQAGRHGGPGGPTGGSPTNSPLAGGGT